MALALDAFLGHLGVHVATLNALLVPSDVRPGHPTWTPAGLSCLGLREGGGGEEGEGGGGGGRGRGGGEEGERRGREGKRGGEEGEGGGEEGEGRKGEGGGGEGRGRGGERREGEGRWDGEGGRERRVGGRKRLAYWSWVQRQHTLVALIVQLKEFHNWCMPYNSKAL